MAYHSGAAIKISTVCSKITTALKLSHRILGGQQGCSAGMIMMPRLGICSIE